jgi:hypothetical protein
MKYVLWSLLSSTLILAACAKQAPSRESTAGGNPPAAAEPADTPREATVWIAVDGMTKIQGIT